MKKYDSYKDSGIEWIGEIPKHWVSYRIDWVSTIIRGNSEFKKDELLDDGEYVALQYGKVYKVDIVDENFNYYVNNEFYKENQVVSRGDTVLVSTSETIADLGHTCYYDKEQTGLIGGEQILLKPNHKFLYEKYLYHYAKRFCVELKKYAKGLKVFRYNTNDLKSIFIAIPSIEEQTLIANYLDHKTQQIDELIAKKERLIELLNEERTATINQAVTKGINPNVPMKDSGIEWLGEIPEHWEVKKLKYVCQLIVDKTSIKPEYILALENITSWTGEIIGDPFENKMEGDVCLFEPNDVLFNKLRPYLAKVVKVTSYGGCMGELLVLRTSEGMTSDFLYYRLISEMIITIVDGSTYGTKMPRASWDKFIRNILISVPPKDEQIEITSYLKLKTSKIEETISQVTQEIDLLKEYKTALISEAVTGKIDVRNEVLN